LGKARGIAVMEDLGSGTWWIFRDTDAERTHGSGIGASGAD